MNLFFLFPLSFFLFHSFPYNISYYDIRFFLLHRPSQPLLLLLPFRTLLLLCNHGRSFVFVSVPPHPLI